MKAVNACPTCHQHIRTGRSGDDETARDIDLIYRDAIAHWGERASRCTTPATVAPAPVTTATTGPMTTQRRHELRLHCDDCSATFAADRAAHMFRHTTSEHRRAPRPTERTPRSATHAR